MRGRNYYYSNFIDEETKALEVSILAYHHTISKWWNRNFFLTQQNLASERTLKRLQKAWENYLYFKRLKLKHTRTNSSLA